MSKSPIKPELRIVYSGALSMERLIKFARGAKPMSIENRKRKLLERFARIGLRAGSPAPRGFKLFKFLEGGL